MKNYNVFALPGPDNSESMALGLNKTGSVVGYALKPDAGVIWRAGSIPFLLLANKHSLLQDVNDLGEAVGARETESSTTMIPMLVRDYGVHDLPLPAESAWAATDINDKGLVCGHEFTFGSRGFIYDSHANKIIRWIDDKTFVGTVVVAINSAGFVAGYTHSNVFYYSSALRLMGPGTAQDLNDGGIVCGSLSSPPTLPCIWDTSNPSPSAEELPLPHGFTGGIGRGINNQRDVVGCCWPQSKEKSAFIYSYSEGKSEDLNKLISDPDWHLEDASSINDNGSIAGYGSYQGKSPMAFRLATQPLAKAPHGPVKAIPFGSLLIEDLDWIDGPWPPIPVPSPESWAPMSAAKRDVLVGLALDELATYMTAPGLRKKMRTELLEAVRANLDRLMESVAESPTLPAGIERRAEMAPEIKARMDEILALRFGPRANR